MDYEINDQTAYLIFTLHASTLQLFSQWSYRATQKLTLNSGVHFLYLKDNSTYSIEPRASGPKYELNERESFSAGYGLHSQMQPIGCMSLIEQPDGSFQYGKSWV